MRILLTTFNSSYIHKNLALRWLYVARPEDVDVEVKEYTINDDVNDMINYILDNDFDAVGFSTYIWNVNETKAVIAAIRKQNQTIKIVLGGPEVTYENDDWFALGIDGIVLGEGERVFWDFIIDNDATYVKTEAEEFKPIKKEDVSYLETLESPYTLDFDMEHLSNQYLYVETSRGCPFRCSYCLSSLDNQVRFFSLSYLEDLFESIKSYPINQVKFLDRTFNAHKERTKDLYSMLRHYPNIDSFQVEIVADRLSDDLIEMINAKENRDRFRYEVGIQSYNQDTLKSVDRTQDNERLNEVMREILDHGVTVHADLIAGLPYEGLESFQKSFNELANLYPTELQLGILKLLKGTKMKRDALALGYIASEEPPYDVLETPWLSGVEMEEINITAKGVDRSLNRGILEHTVKHLNDYVYHGDLFSLYYQLGEIFEHLGIGYQKHQLFILVYERFKDKLDKDVLKSLLTLDYFKNEKQKPKVLFKQEDVTSLNRKLVEGGYFSQEEVYRYSRVFRDYRDEDALIVALFNKHQKPCALYTVNIKENICQKIS